MNTLLSDIERHQTLESAAWHEHRQKMNTSGLVPLGHAVLVRPYEPEIQVGKIHIPDNVRLTMQSLDQRAEVIAVGPLAWNGEEARAKPGDRVLVTKFAGFVAGTTLTKDGQTYRIINDRDVFCRIDWRE